MKLPLAVHAAWLALALIACSPDSTTPPDSATSPRRQSADSPAGHVTRVTTVEGITEYRLDNGLQVLLFRDPSKATITVNMTYLVGSVDESYGETGMAHLLEHMLFKGSTKFPDILAAIRSHGAQFNGTTSWDRTNYFETFDANEANLEWALDLESDRMINAFVAQKRPRHRDDGRAQRVRARREQPDRRAVRARDVHRLSVARLRQVADRQPQRHRERADPALAGVLPPALPARQRRARHRGPLRGAARARADRPVLRRDSASRARAHRQLHRSSRTKTASARSSCAASATCRS